MFLELMSALLLAGAPADAPKSAPTTEPQEERKVCRKQIETGSLIKGKKVCFTAKQWQKIADANREEIERTSSLGSASGQ